VTPPLPAKPDVSDHHEPQNVHAAGWRPVLLVSLAVVSALWVLGIRFLPSPWRGIPSTPLTTLFLLLAAAVVQTGVPARYKWSIVTGLGCSAVGDLSLILPGNWFVPGLGSFLAAHLCYLWAFTGDSRLAGRKLPFVVWAAFGILLLACLWPGVAGPLRLPVLLYTLAISAMAAQASSRALAKRDAAAILAAVGAALFVASDSVLAFQRFRHPLAWGRFVVLGTYFAAQGGIALSVVLHRRPAR